MTPQIGGLLQVVRSMEGLDEVEALNGDHRAAMAEAASKEFANHTSASQCEFGPTPDVDWQFKDGVLHRFETREVVRLL